jgi:hypothetical protein
MRSSPSTRRAGIARQPCPIPPSIYEGSTVDELLVGDPHRVGERDVEKPAPGRRVVHGGNICKEDLCLLDVREGLRFGRRDARVGVEVIASTFALRQSVREEERRDDAGVSCAGRERP